MKRLGIIDWGIGGISIYKLIKQRLGDLPVTYFSDTGATPYGKMSRPELVARLDHVIAFLHHNGVTHIVIGCNAASTAIDQLAKTDVPIEGVIDAAVEMTASLNPMRLGLIGGRRTVVSGVYRRAFASRGIKVEQRIAQPLSGLIEAGDLSSETLRSECKRILSPLKDCSHILLACTHYPAVRPVLSEYVSARTVLIDPAPALVDRVRGWQISPGGVDRMLTTGDTKQMTASALAAFGCELHRVKRVEV